MKKYLYMLLASFLFIPTFVFALSNNYVDKVSNYTQTSTDENKVSLYLFYGQECPHCEEERNFLESFKEDYKNYLNVYEFEVWHNTDNSKIMEKLKKDFEVDNASVPFTIIGDAYFIGYSEATASRIENKVKEYAEIENNPNNVDIPILGNINMKDVSIPLVAITLGFIDGFNPCAMWILLFLISMFFRMENRKKAWILGYTFLFISGLVYFLSMLGINFVLSVVAINWLKIAIAIFILIAGFLNLKKYLKIRKEEAGCNIVDEKKRKKFITKIKKIMDSKNFVLALLGIITLAVSVNLIELACSLGFPVIFTEILSLNNIEGITKIIYLLLYILFYLIDDLAVFTISMITVQATGITNKYNKLCTLISAIIMIIMGLLLLFKPDWLMMNF